MFQKILISILLVLLAAGHADAQRFMLLQKGANQKSRIKYEEGDRIVYQQKGLDFFITDRIAEIHPDFLVLTENILRPEDITVVDIRDKDERNRTLRNLSGLMYAGGAMLLTAETINGLYHEKKFSYSNGGLIVSGSLFASGFVLSRIRYKYFKNKGRNKIQIIYLEEQTE